jgi:enoyl-[acyl-carrier-protein] reductase (NADH)
VEPIREEFLSASPLRRLVTADDVAQTVAFLASPRAAAITGEDVNVSTGVVMY